MKTLNLYSLITILIVTTFNAAAQKTKKNTENVLEITGSVLLNDHRTTKYSISVYLDGIKLDSIYTKKAKTLPYYLDYNKVYTLVFQKEDCTDKVIILNTQLPDGLKKMKYESFDFEVEMSESLIKYSIDTEDYPIAVVNINKAEKSLVASQDYQKLTHKVAEVSPIDFVNVK